jgi:hypothetical protein
MAVTPAEPPELLTELSVTAEDQHTHSLFRPPQPRAGQREARLAPISWPRREPS